MSEVERPWLQRSRSAPPASCPVCGAATMYVGIAGALTCRSAAGDHFEWRPDPGSTVRVESGRLAGCPACGRVDQHDPACWRVGLLLAPGDVVLDSRIIVGGPPFQLQVDATGWSIHDPGDCPHSPRCRGHRKSGDPEWTATELACGRSDDDVETRVCDECVLGDEDPAPWCDCRGDETCGDRTPCRQRAHAPDDCPQLAYLDPIVASEPPPPVEGVLLGRDFTDAAVQRLHPDAAALASLHRPVFGRPPYCWACTSAGRAQVDSSRRVPWPCSTASLALEMMGLTASDISIADRKE